MHGVRLVTSPAPNSDTSATSGWWLRVSVRPAVIQHGRACSYGQCSPPRGQGSVPPRVGAQHAAPLHYRPAPLPCDRPYTVQPARYSERTYSAGTLVFATSPECGSISSTWAVRSARLPSSTISVSGPAWSAKFEPAGVPPLHAAIHSAYTLSRRAYFCAGGRAGISAWRASSSRRGALPSIPATRLPPA